MQNLLNFLAVNASVPRPLEFQAFSGFIAFQMPKNDKSWEFEQYSIKKHSLLNFCLPKTTKRAFQNILRTKKNLCSHYLHDDWIIFVPSVTHHQTSLLSNVIINPVQKSSLSPSLFYLRTTIMYNLSPFFLRPLLLQLFQDFFHICSVPIDWV